MNKQRGVTLIELLIVLVVIGILAAVAYPSYTKQVQLNASGAECAGGLVQLANAMERDLSQNNTYSDLVTGGGFVGTCPIDGGAATYNLSVQAFTASTYTLRATPVGGQANDKCGYLELTNRGGKSAEKDTLAACWR